MIDIDQLCTEVEQSTPAGPDLAYDPDFLALEVALAGKPERQYGSALIAAEPPDWKLVLEHAQTLATGTRDLRIACTLTRALTHMEGLSGLIQGLQLIERLCRAQWAHIHPQLDIDDDNDPTLRMNALAPLSDPAALLLDIRDSLFVATQRFGSCTVRDVEIALGILAPVRGNDAGNIRLGDITAMVKAAHADGSLTRNIAQEAMARTEALYRLLRDLVGGEHAVDLQPLLARLRPLAEYIKNVVPQITTDAMPSAALTTTPPSNRAEPPALPDEIRSRQDVARMLDQICAYFEKNEPSNPAPLLLRRAQRLSTMNFFDIVRDIAPDALGAVETVAGSRPNQLGTNHE